MTRYIVARTSDIPPGGNQVSAWKAAISSSSTSTASSSRCSIAARTKARRWRRRPAWHDWEFDMRNGQSWFDPQRVEFRSYPVAVESGEVLQKGPYVAETFVEDNYVIVET